MNDHNTFRLEVRSYIIGGILSLGITVLVYFAVTGHWAQASFLAAAALAAAALQFLVQTRFFLHLTKQDSTPMMRQSMLFMGIMLLIIVIGSLWIMMNLNYNMGMAPEQMQEYMLKQNKKGF
jgi:cytochrome o ubiquinol oxidase operon protein cyoD